MQIMSELKLRDDILDELEYEPIVDAAHIGVAVDRDVVTLTGHVGSYAQKLAAISRAPGEGRAWDRGRD